MGQTTKLKLYRSVQFSKNLLRFIRSLIRFIHKIRIFASFGNSAGTPVLECNCASRKQFPCIAHILCSKSVINGQGKINMRGFFDDRFKIIKFFVRVIELQHSIRVISEQRIDLSYFLLYFITGSLSAFAT